MRTTAGRRTAAEQKLAPRPAVEVELPVTGRWTALNSPADKVPSHGMHGIRRRAPTRRGLRDSP